MKVKHLAFLTLETIFTVTTSPQHWIISFWVVLPNWVVAGKFNRGMDMWGKVPSPPSIPDFSKTLKFPPSNDPPVSSFPSSLCPLSGKRGVTKIIGFVIGMSSFLFSSISFVLSFFCARNYIGPFSFHHHSQIATCYHIFFVVVDVDMIF